MARIRVFCLRCCTSLRIEFILLGFVVCRKVRSHIQVCVMANLNMVGADLANLNIMDEEKDPLVVVGDDMFADPEYGLCLVG